MDGFAKINRDQCEQRWKVLMLKVFTPHHSAMSSHCTKRKKMLEWSRWENSKLRVNLCCFEFSARITKWQKKCLKCFNWNALGWSLHEYFTSDCTFLATLRITWHKFTYTTSHSEPLNFSFKCHKAANKLNACLFWICKF